MCPSKNVNSSSLPPSVRTLVWLLTTFFENVASKRLAMLDVSRCLDLTIFYMTILAIVDMILHLDSLVMMVSRFGFILAIRS